MKVFSHRFVIKTKRTCLHLHQSEKLRNTLKDLKEINPDAALKSIVSTTSD